MSYKVMGASNSQFQHDAQQEILLKINNALAKPPTSPPGPDITTIPALQLQEMIFARRITLPDVVRLFHHKKVLEQNFHCSLTDVFFDAPLAQAEAWQKRIDAGKLTKEEAPLLGYVLVLKDHMLMRDTRSTCGLV